MPRIKIDPGLAALGLAAAGVITSAGAAVALVQPQSGFAAWTDLAAVREARADALARRAASKPDLIAPAVLETRRSLRQAPATPTAWLRLAHLESLRSGTLGAAGNRALAASYAVAPYGPDDTAWRLAFAFNHWTSLDRANRLSALDELSVARGRIDLRALERDVRDPAGRLALSLSTGDA